MDRTVKRPFRWIPGVCYALIVLFISFLFFTNDFGLVDIHKTAFISSLGIDREEDDFLLTAQIAVPLPSENGENVSYTQVRGKGPTLASCLNDVNAQTGFYPKLVFCRLIVLGESCFEYNLFQTLDYFFRNEYSLMTTFVACCKGSAEELLRKPAPLAGATGLTVQRVLSEELKKSANVSTVNLKMIALQQASYAKSCYMPYVETISFSGASQSGGKTGASSAESSGKEQTGFICRRTAFFTDGVFGGVLTEEQAFAYNLFASDVRRAVLPLTIDGIPVTLALKQNHTHMSVKVEQGVPVVTFYLRSSAQIQDEGIASTPRRQAQSDAPSKELLVAAEEKIEAEIASLIAVTSERDCDVFSVREKLFRCAPDRYESLSPRLWKNIRIVYDVDVRATA